MKAFDVNLAYITPSLLDFRFQNEIASLVPVELTSALVSKRPWYDAVRYESFVTLNVPPLETLAVPLLGQVANLLIEKRAKLTGFHLPASAFEKIRNVRDR